MLRYAPKKQVRSLMGEGIESSLYPTVKQEVSEICFIIAFEGQTGRLCEGCGGVQCNSLWRGYDSETVNRDADIHPI